MGEALYRKYRPRKLADVVGQPHITSTLDNAIKSGRVSHGYLFSGPRGVGKTSVARILAHQLNNFDYGDSRGSLDIIEIDAASNRRIDEIRELREKVHIAPVSGTYKVYIIDEVHMLTREAFNALLKTLEEPPSHVIFILATTEIHKLPETIVSRTQRFSFKEVAKTDVVEHLRTLAQKEGITIDNDALELLAEHGGGSFRDSISLLDQVGSQKHVTLSSIETILGLPSKKVINSIIQNLQDCNVTALVNDIETQRTAGMSATLISKQLITYIRIGITEKTLPFTMLNLSRELLNVPSSSDPFQLLEICLIDYALTVKPNAILDNTAHNVEPKKLTTSPESTTIHIPKPKKQPKQSTVLKTPTIEAWTFTINEIKKTNNTLYGVARMAEPTLKDDALLLRVPFPFHKKRLTDERNSRIISELLSSQGFNGAFEVIVEKREIKSSKHTHTVTSPPSDTLESVKAIFGGGEVMET